MTDDRSADNAAPLDMISEVALRAWGPPGPETDVSFFRTRAIELAVMANHVPEYLPAYNEALRRLWAGEKELGLRD